MNFEQADALNRAIRQIGLKHRGLAADLLGRLGLHPGQEILLLELDAHGARTQTQLAAGLGCEPPTVTIMAQKLEAAGWIARRPSPQDGRATIVELTERGRELMPRLKDVWRELAETTVGGLETTSFDQLLEVVADLARGLTPINTR